MRMNKNALGFSLAWSVVTLFVASGPARLAAQAKSLVNVDPNGVGIHGYDPVAYFTEGKAVRGDAQFSSSYGGAVYYFQSGRRRGRFRQRAGQVRSAVRWLLCDGHDHGEA